MRTLFFCCCLLLVANPAVAAEPTLNPVNGYWWRLPVIPEPNWQPGHRGLDYRTKVGATVRAPRSGVVSYVGRINLVEIITVTDNLGLKHSLLPVRTDLSVGDVVTAGMNLGEVASSNHCSVPCLHWGVRRSGRYLDPRWLLPRWVVRLPIHERG